MTATSAYAPFGIAYGARTPLISASEYNNSSTAMDTRNLIPGNAEANANALIEIIGRASSWCDQFMFGSWGTVAATVETENARSWGTYRNTLSLHGKYWPIIEVQSFTYSPLPGGLTTGFAASVIPANNITIYPQSFEVSLLGNTVFGLGGSSNLIRGVEYDCQYTYVAGWPNTTLAASVAAGDQSIQPLVTTGIYPNTIMTLFDLPYDEPIIVDPSYVPGSAVVPLQSPLQYTHSTQATVTSLPPVIKQAAILATTAFIKERGSGALLVQDIGEIRTQQSGFSQGSGSDWSQAKEMLHAFKMQYVGW